MYPATRISLEQINIPEPCSVPWSDMQGDHRVRHCQHCDKYVYNLSALSRREVEQLLADRLGQLCVNFCRRRDGTVVTRDFRARPTVAGIVLAVAARMVLPSVLSLALAGCHSNTEGLTGDGFTGGAPVPRVADPAAPSAPAEAPPTANQ